MSKKLITVNVNGRQYEKAVEPRTLLIHFLREELNLTGAHIGCETSHCGACTVDVDGRSVKSCTHLAVQCDGSDVLTVEGLASQREFACFCGFYRCIHVGLSIRLLSAVRGLGCSGLGFLQLLGGVLHRLDDVLVSGATAQVATHACLLRV